MSLTPCGLLTTSKCEWDEEEGDRSDEKDSTDDIELPEHVRCKVLETELLERSSVAGKGTGSGSSSTSDDQDGNDAERGD